jgi:3'-phosphoadenosine 5'-phosphosulfate sulfotransferase (PAPS reductase)/FAD synthetase
MLLTVSDLRQRQSLSLEEKIAHSKAKIREFYNYFCGDVVISFSGGKDSTVLLHLARSVYPDIPAVFCDTGLEYPEIRKFVKTFDNVDIVRPTMPFPEVIEKYGYPLVSKEIAKWIYEYRHTKSEKLKHTRIYGDKKHGWSGKHGQIPLKWRILIESNIKIADYCCYALKKAPLRKYAKETGRKNIVGTLAADSHRRQTAYLQTGCNNFKSGKSVPLSIWYEQDILAYIKAFNLPVCSVYGELQDNGGKLCFLGCQHTGCLFCGFGVHMESYPNRFQQLHETHPKLWDYCINKLGLGKILDYIHIPYKSHGILKQQTIEDFIHEGADNASQAH